MLIKVKPVDGENNLLKNTRSKVVLNNNDKAYREYMAKRNLIDKQDTIENRVGSLEEDINSIKSSLDNLTKLLEKALEK